MSTITQNETEHLIAIIVKWHGPTNFKGARVSLTLPHWENKRVSFSYDHASRSMVDNATQWLASRSVEPSTLLSLGQEYVLGVSFAQVNAVLAAFNNKK